MKQVQESMKPVASFNVVNSATQNLRMALLPGHFCTEELVYPNKKDGSTITSPSGERPILAHGNASNLKLAGYECDQVMDDIPAYVDVTTRATLTAPDFYSINVSSVRGRTRVADFLNYVKYSGLKVTKIRLTDKTDECGKALFGGEIEVSQSSIGSKGGSDFLQLSTYIDPRNFNQGVIEVDLEEENLLLDETTVVIMDIPAKANFQIDFILG